MTPTEFVLVPWKARRSGPKLEPIIRAGLIGESLQDEAGTGNPQEQTR